MGPVIVQKFEIFAFTQSDVRYAKPVLPKEIRDGFANRGKLWVATRIIIGQRTD